MRPYRPAGLISAMRRSRAAFPGRNRILAAAPACLNLARMIFGKRKHRMNRTTYWVCLALLAVWALFAAFVLHKTGGFIDEFVVAAVCVPRLHDMGKSGWIVGAVLVGYLAFVLIMATSLNADLISASAGIVAIGMAFVLVYLGLTPGDPGENRYGEQPSPGINLRLKPQESRSA